MASNAEGEQAKRQATPKTNLPKGKGPQTPKAKPFLFDNSANENAIDWTLDQLSEQTRFVPRLYALPLFRPSSLSVPVSPCLGCRACAPWRYEAVLVPAAALHANPWRRHSDAAPALALHADPWCRPRAIHDAAPASVFPALRRCMLLPPLLHLSHFRSAAMGSP